MANLDLFLVWRCGDGGDGQSGTKTERGAVSQQTNCNTSIPIWLDDAAVVGGCISCNECDFQHNLSARREFRRNYRQSFNPAGGGASDETPTGLRRKSCRRTISSEK